VSEASYDAELSRALAEVEPESFWFRGRNRLVVSLLERRCPSLTSLLDVGCGNGFVLSAIRDAYPRTRLVGVDIVDDALAAAAGRVPDAELARLDVLDLPFDAEFDAVCALDVLEHVDDDTQALRRIRSAMRPGGTAVLLVPQHPWLWSGADTLAHHRRRYRRGELLQAVRSAGLDLAFVSSFVTLLLPALALSRIVRRGSFGVHDLRRTLVPGPLNRPFERILDAERWLVAAKSVSLPVGGSLVVIATRPR
jgi:SAM-dependent methyltransferase